MSWTDSSGVEAGLFVLWVVIALIVLYRYPRQSRTRTIVWLGTTSNWIGYGAPDALALVDAPEIIGATLAVAGILVGLACFGYSAYLYTRS